MNKRCFRLIFSKSLGFLIPVAETTKAQRKPGQQTTATSPPKPFNGSLKHLVLSVLLAGMPGLTVADILPDADKPSGTSVINAANGVPVIEIANPNDKGLSHNRFNQFDVPQPGVIFNNSRVNGLSQL
ncbi:MAG: ESPR-type extended signal peptide-containing protein, partial [Pseudomonas sp.]|uniref:ESPR-type extended signal peptide-containing protein n=1 Tax=Pseudomonas sp. TaxID=306 RepID=UPI0030F1D0CF